MKLSNTIAEARQYILDEGRKGVKCPCCSQLVKVYKYKILAPMASILIQMYKAGDRWVHVMDELKPRNGDYGKLRWWGLITQDPTKPDEDKRNTGYWRLTERGKRFVEGKELVHKHIEIFDNEYIGVVKDSKLVSIQEALGTKFKYSELMGSAN